MVRCGRARTALMQIFKDDALVAEGQGASP